MIQKIFNDKNYVHLLLLVASLMIFIVPIGCHAYRVIGPLLLVFFSISKFSQNKLSAWKEFLAQNRMDIFLFGLLIGLSMVSFVPQTVGTLFIFASLYFGIRQKIELSSRLALLSLIFFLIFLTAQLYCYLNKIPFYGRPSNPDYLGTYFILFFWCCSKLSYRFGQLVTFIGAIILKSRMLLVSLAMYLLFQIPLLKKRLSAKIVGVFFCAATLSLLIIGAWFSEMIIKVPKHPRHKTGYTFHLQTLTLNQFSAGRIELNNNFMHDISGNYYKILFGAGLNYTGTKTGRNFTPVHNSVLEILAHQGLIFLVIYLILLYRFFAKHGETKDFPAIISLITFASLFNGMLNTFPLILTSCLLVTKKSKSKPLHNFI